MNTIIRNILLLLLCAQYANLEAYNNKQPYRIAFVKQVVFQDLYCTNSPHPKDIVFSTFRRSGPAALFAAFDTDFYIVDTESDSECQIWQEKAIYQKGIAYYESLKTTIPPEGLLAGHAYPQGHYAVKCAYVDWSNYDIVITMDIAVPERIVKKYPRTLWAYYVGEGFEPSFKKSFVNPIAGYDAFLTQDYAENPSYKEHVIEFPYHLLYYGCYHDLLGVEKNYARHGIFLDSHTNKALSEKYKSVLDRIVPINRKSAEQESFATMIERLRRTKYFIIYLKPHGNHRKMQPHRKFLRGNAIPEAIAAGNLVIAQANCLKNTSLLSPKTMVNSFKELFERIIYFEQHPNAYAQELAMQQEKVNWFCFNRPMQELFAHCDRKKTSL